MQAEIIKIYSLFLSYLFLLFPFPNRKSIHITLEYMLKWMNMIAKNIWFLVRIYHHKIISSYARFKNTISNLGTFGE